MGEPGPPPLSALLEIKETDVLQRRGATPTPAPLIRCALGIGVGWMDLWFVATPPVETSVAPGGSPGGPQPRERGSSSSSSVEPSASTPVRTSVRGRLGLETPVRECKFWNAAVDPAHAPPRAPSPPPRSTTTGEAAGLLVEAGLKLRGGGGRERSVLGGRSCGLQEWHMHERRMKCSPRPALAPGPGPRGLSALFQMRAHLPASSVRSCWPAMHFSPRRSSRRPDREASGSGAGRVK